MTLELKGQPNEQLSRGPELMLVRWGKRFWTWLINFIEESFMHLVCIIFLINDKSY